MQAVVARAWGEPDVLRLEQVEDPVPGAGEILVELRASSVNWHDVLVRRTGRGYPLPSILGMDGAGVRRDTGEKVVILPALRWGEDTAAPDPAFAFLGDATDGTYAELVAVPEGNVFPKPPGWSWEEAAALPTAGVTAQRALFTRARTLRGETVLVLGAGGGVSTLTVSLASAADARVLVTSSSTEKLERARELGAIGGALYTDEDWVEQIRGLSGGGVDVALDGVGADLSATLSCLRPGGRAVVFGATGGAAAQIDIPRLYFSHCSILGTSIGNANDFTALLRSIGQGNWRPVLDSVRPLSQACAAHERIEARAQFGKLVLSHEP